MEKLKVYKLTINAEDDETIVNMISIVEDPAIEIQYLAFSKEQPVKEIFKIQDTAKRNLLGPLMVPDTLIYRRNQTTGEEFYVVMDAITIENAVKKFAKKRYNSNINANHSDHIVGGTLIESWIVTDPTNDKANAYGFKDIKAGTWFGVVNLEPDAWNAYINQGDLKFGGFSIEGIFEKSKEPIDMAFETNLDPDLMCLAEIVAKIINKSK